VSADTIKDLLLLSRLDEVECVAVGDGDQRSGAVPGWCELILDLSGEDGGRVRRLHLTRHDAELIIEVLVTVLHPSGGPKTVRSRLWAELDDTMEFLMDNDDPEDEDRVRAKTLAMAIAMMSNPHADPPNIDRVKALAIERWEARR